MKKIRRCKNCIHFKSTCPYPEWMSEMIEDQIDEMIKKGVDVDTVFCDGYTEEDEEFLINIWGI